MNIDITSDLHGNFPELLGGDLLIIAGDLTATHTETEFREFFHWLLDQEYRKVVFIGGNHDSFMEKNDFQWFMNITGQEIVYLCDSGTEFDGLKIWGTPYTHWFHGVNPSCKAFMKADRDLKPYWDKIPRDTDILITHSPPRGVLDNVRRRTLDENGNPIWESENVGSKTLRKQLGRVKPKLWVFGHIHGGYGELKTTTLSGDDYHFVNASHVNEDYDPVNPPIRVIL